MTTVQFDHVLKVAMPMIDAPPGSADPAAHYAQLALTARVSKPDATTKSIVATVSGATSPETHLFAPMCGSLSFVPAGQATSLPGSFVAPAGGALQLHIWLVDVFAMTGQAPAVARDIFFTGFDSALTQSAVKVLIDLTDAAVLRALWTKHNGTPPAQNMPIATLLTDCFTYFMAGDLSILVKSGAVIGRLPLTVVGTHVETAVTITANGLLGEFISPIRIIRSLPWFDKTLPAYMYQHPLFVAVRKSAVIDPGHGGDSGTLYNDPVHQTGPSSWNNASGVTVGGVTIREKDVTLAVGLRCGAILEKYGYSAVFTRTQNVNLTTRDRAAVAADIEAPAFVSIHFNGADGTAQGTETWCHPNHSANSGRLGALVQAKMLEVTGYHDRNTGYANGVQLANEGVLSPAYQYSGTAACLAEPSFIDVQAEADRLSTADYVGKLAMSFANAIEEYISTWDD